MNQPQALRLSRTSACVMMWSGLPPPASAVTSVEYRIQFVPITFDRCRRPSGFGGLVDLCQSGGQLLTDKAWFVWPQAPSLIMQALNSQRPLDGILGGDADWRLRAASRLIGGGLNSTPSSLWRLREADIPKGRYGGRQPIGDEKETSSPREEGAKCCCDQSGLRQRHATRLARPKGSQERRRRPWCYRRAKADEVRPRRGTPEKLIEDISPAAGHNLRGI